LRRFSRKTASGLLMEKIPHFALMVAGMAMVSITAGKAEGVYTPEQYPWIQSVAQPGFRVCFYLWKTLLPFHLSPLYWFRPELGLPQILGWLVLLGITAFLLIQRR